MLEDEGRICGVSPWHDAKPTLMSFRDLSRFSVDHPLPCVEGVCQQCVTVILAFLYDTLYLLFRQADVMPSVVMIMLNSLLTLQIVPGISMHPSLLPTALPHFIRHSVSVFAPLMVTAMLRLGARYSVSTRGLSSFMGLLKY